MNSLTTKCLRFGLSAKTKIRCTSQESCIPDAHSDVRFMSSNLRLVSRLSMTMCVNLGSSSPAVRPPFEVIRFATFASLHIQRMRQQTFLMAPQGGIYPLFGYGIFTLQAWLDFHSVRPGVGRRVNVEAPDGGVQSRDWEERGGGHVQTYKCLNIMSWSYCIALSSSPILSSAFTSCFA